MHLLIQSSLHRETSVTSGCKHRRKLYKHCGTWGKTLELVWMNPIHLSFLLGPGCSTFGPYMHCLGVIELDTDCIFYPN